jgi:hypothetical protein
MKPWHYFALSALAVAGAIYVYTHQEGLGLSKYLHSFSREPAGTDQAEVSTRPSRMSWQTVERPDDGFRIDLPGEAKNLQVPAYNERGGSEQVKMVVATPDADTTFAVTWEDDPPVARASHTPEKTLDMARDGMLARTQTTLVSESRTTHRGDPALEVSARNGGGGVLNALFIYSGNRLYMLIALFPSAGARREQDVKRFFNSFAPPGVAVIPETLPSASQN